MEKDGFVNYVWDSSQNNGATEFDNLDDDFRLVILGTNYVEMSSESYITDFESDESGFVAAQDYSDSNGDVISWDYGVLEFNQLTEGPESCKSGDMCWGTNLYDEDYTDDYVHPQVQTNQHGI